MAKRITLTEWDLALARQLATLRQSMNRLAEVPSSSSGCINYQDYLER